MNSLSHGRRGWSVSRLAWPALSIIALLASLSCSDSTGPTGGVAAVRFNLTAAPNIIVGQTVQLTPVPLNASGNPISVVCVRTFSSDAPAVATVDKNGLVTGVSPGTAIITATLNNVPQSIPVIVVSGNSLTVNPRNATVGVGATVQYTATLRDVNGAIVTGKPITWTSSNTAIATINSTGVATGVSPGTVTITATSEGATGTAALTVSSAAVSTISVAPQVSTIGVGAAETLTATVQDGSGNVLPNRIVTWQTSNSAIATVSSTGNNTAQVSGVTPGTVTITATSEGKSGNATVTVTNTGSGSISVSPPSVSTSTGNSVQLTTTVRDAGGNAVSATVSYSSNNTAVATVSSSGVVTAVAPGSATITVSANGESTTVPVTVSATPVASISISPSSPAVCAGQSIQLTVTLRDASGNVLSGRSVTFSSSNTLVARVDAAGVLTGVAAGTATITAASEGKSTSVTATICAAAAASLDLAPAAATLGVGANLQLVATARDNAGNVLSGQPITFTSSNTGVATVDATGKVTGVGAGTANITAADGGLTATSAITVVPAPVGSVGLTPTTVSPCVGQTAQLTAIVRDTLGNILTGRLVTFTSSAPATATVDVNGLVTGVATGLATITATVEGKSATAQANVCLAAVATVALAPATATVRVGATATLFATVRDAFGNVLSGQTVTFSSSNTAVATVAADGTVTGVTPGIATITATSSGKTATSIITVIP